jgi:hypothetical protein
MPLDSLTSMNERHPALPLPYAARARPARAGYHLPMLAVVAGLVLLATLMMTRLGINAFEIFVRDAGKTADPAPVAVTVGQVDMDIPRNMIRFAAERGGVQLKLDLHLHWPTLDGFSVERAAMFQSSATEAPIVYVTIRPAGDAMSPEDRFRTVYPRVLADDMRQTARGYIVRTFREGFGYDGEELYIARHPERPLSARCENPAEGTGGVCISEFRTDTGLDVAYRFRHSILEDWRAIDEGIRTLIKDFSAVAAP